MNFSLPSKGYAFWPVGNGDSTTIVVDKDETVMQVDLHHTNSSDEDDDSRSPVVDRLEECLPENENGEPFLAVFALTHPHTDHIKGFEELLDRIEIGEIWHTPRIFHEYHKDLGDDASAFKREVKRRREKIIENEGDVESGDRVRVIGHDDVFDEEYERFPEQ
jgi:beta-lactamase superfamily II metal-dependent hydrolase